MQVPDLREALKQHQDGLPRVDCHDLADLEPVCPLPSALWIKEKDFRVSKYRTLRTRFEFLAKAGIFERRAQCSNPMVVDRLSRVKPLLIQCWHRKLEIDPNFAYSKMKCFWQV